MFVSVSLYIILLTYSHGWRHFIPCYTQYEIITALVNMTGSAKTDHFQYKLLVQYRHKRIQLK